MHFRRLFTFIENEIKYQGIPNCNTCIHFIKVQDGSRCRLFIQSGTALKWGYYLPALQCRLDSTKCGIDGVFYRKDDHK